MTLRLSHDEVAHQRCSIAFTRRCDGDVGLTVCLQFRVSGLWMQQQSDYREYRQIVCGGQGRRFHRTAVFYRSTCISLATYPTDTARVVITGGRY